MKQFIYLALALLPLGASAQDLLISSEVQSPGAFTSKVFNEGQEYRSFCHK